MAKSRKRKPAPRKPKAPPAVTPERVETVLRLRLDGAQFHDLRQFAADASPDGTAARGGPPWQVGDDDLWELIGKADDLLVGRAESNRARAYAVAVARREALYARAVNAGDYAAALGCLKDIAQLQGTYPKVAELVKLVKEQGATIRELEADRDGPRQLGPAEDGAPPGGEGPVEGRAAEAAPEAAGGNDAG